MLARRFLYLVVILIVLTLAAGLAWTLMQDRLMRMAFVPSASFAPMPDASAPDYATADAWLARPGLANDPTRWLPADVAAKAPGRAAIFYIAPTTYLSRDQWNAPLDDAGANGRLRLFAQSQASAFTDAGTVWAPRYRQATLGAFLAAGDDRSQAAIDFAYGDVLRAFDAFVAAQPADRPIILAGHSQGALHLLRLLQERARGTALRRRVVAVYAIGWPISLTADLLALGLPTCQSAGDFGCIIGWQSFAEPADPRLIRAYFDESRGLTGQPRHGTAMLCVNPLTGHAGDAAPASANRGALVPDAGLASARLVPGRVPARCTAEGLLLIGPPPAGFDAYVLPGNNYHVFDYALFWANVRADATARLAAYEAHR
ncbi:DUF3089 domain-containing protein [uncultured Sphingomonas sp.]|uniref:DUF3089 domain-containing protein n=1 Tax=uncultured Sphingomonas sp. TaxID=158754 RepID=UPI0025E0C370|nr:DUF3089 domain-containing protein [uncultured Sphingomonas sp.]